MITLTAKQEQVSPAYSAAVTRVLCDKCRDAFERWVAGDDNVDPGAKCEDCEARIVQAAVTAHSVGDLIQRFIDMGLLVQTRAGVDFPVLAAHLLNHAVRREPRIARELLLAVAVAGSDALVAEMWSVWRTHEDICQRLKAYTVDEASRLLIMPVDAHLLRNCRGDYRGTPA